jgi:hypothetical protein
MYTRQVYLACESGEGERQCHQNGEAELSNTSHDASPTEVCLPMNVDIRALEQTEDCRSTKAL